MRVLVAGADRAGALERYFERGLRALGHEVSICDTHAAVVARLRLVRFPVLSGLEQSWYTRHYNAILLGEARRLRPDVLLVVKGLEVHPATLEAVRRECGSLLVNYNPDSPLNPLNTNRHLLNSISLYDLHLTWGEFLMPHLTRLGARHVAYLPFGYDPLVQRPVELDQQEKAELGADVCFVGSWEPARESLLEPLARAGHDLVIWGPNWQHLGRESQLKNHLRGGEIWELDVAKVVAASRISLNFIRAQNEDAHNMRTYELPAFGRFMLTTRTREQESLLGEGVGMACFEGPEELREKVDNYLAQSEERERIAKTGHDIVVGGKHTYTDRMRQMMDRVASLS